MRSDSKIYIPGHRGLLGSAVVAQLRSLGFNNLILRSRTDLDLLDSRSVDSFFQSEHPEYVIDCAAKVGGIEANVTYPAEFLFENLQIQNNLIWSSKKHEVKKFLFVGSSCVYPRDCPQPMKEDYLLDGKPETANEAYAIAKIAGLKLCEYIYKEFELNFVSCMPVNIYGPNASFEKESSHVVPALIRRFHEAKIQSLDEVVIWGTGKSRREFLYVDDLADAICFLMENFDDPQFINVGTGEDISIKELALSIKKMVGYDGKLVFDETKPDGLPKKLLDVSKINNLGWKHKTNLDEGLKKTYQYYIDQMSENK